MSRAPSHPVTRPQRLTTDLQRLAEQVHTIETGASGGGGQVQDSTCDRVVSTGWPTIDAALPGGGLSRRIVHEWMGGSLLLTHLAWQATAPVETGPPNWAVWIGRDCWPYPHALVREGREGRRLLMRSIWVDAPDAATRLWAIDQALACPAIGAIVADGSRFDMPATRRLQLSARRGGALLLLARPPTERDELSAAGTRWWVSPQPSPSDQPRWRVRLLRCKGACNGVSFTGTESTSMLRGAAHPGEPGAAWLVERSHAQGDLRLATDVADRSAEAPLTDAPARVAG